MAIVISIFIGGLLGILIYLLIKYPDRSIGTKPRPDLNGPKGLPLIGNYLDILNNKGLLTFGYETLMKYGPNATYTLPGIGRYITTHDPECVEHVMKTKFETYVKPKVYRDMFYDLLGNGIFIVDGDNWKIQRKLMSHLFNVKNFREIICVTFEEETKKALNILEQLSKTGETLDLRDFFCRFTLDSFGKITFGLDFKCLTNPDDPVKFAQEFDFAQSVLHHRIVNPFWKITELFTEEGRKMRESCKWLSDFSHQLIESRKNDLEALKDPNDILNLFMNARHYNGEKFTDEELKDVILNFIIAGRDSTAHTLSWMMYNIMTNPSVEEKLIKEVNSLLSPENPISNYDDIKQFQYTQATFYETLRLYPSVPRTSKLCTEDDVLPNGIQVYAGDILNWSAYSMGRYEGIWGNDVLNFIPDRFLNSEDGLKPSQYKFPSFNAGPRLCLGQQFATVEALMLSTAVLRQFKLEMIPGQKCPPDYARTGILSMKDPLLVKVHHRR